MIIKKIRKLQRDPKLFFSDMIKKRINNKTARPQFLKVKNGRYKYSIVSAVFGVEKYINQFIRSVKNQSLDFENNIEIIFIDDGSTDKSSEIIKKWAKKYPRNIFYYYKKNGGQASARNLGMTLATGDWITFSDPDDSFDKNYFLSVDKSLSNENYDNITLLSCNYIFNIEGQGLKDTHPLRHRYQGGNKKILVSDMKKDFQMAVNSAFFNRKQLISSGLKAKEDIKPNFEDGHFVASYLLKNMKRSVIFCSDAKYLYLKRSDQSSTLDGSLSKAQRYTDVVSKGYLDILKNAKNKHGRVPEWLQNTIIYELFWLIRYGLNNSARLAFLSKTEQEKFISETMKCFSFIETKTILKFDLAGCWFFHKKGILNLFKQTAPNFEISYIDKTNLHENTIRFRFYSHFSDPVESITVAGDRSFPVIKKRIDHKILDKTFIYEHLVTFRLHAKKGMLILLINGKKSRISMNGTQFHNGIYIEEIFIDESNHKESLQLSKREVNNKYSNAWLIMDRDTQADDNGEHFYDFIKTNHPEINAFFILNKSSHDWKRLKEKGFKLLDFRSKEHEDALGWAVHLISSHADQYIISQLSPKHRYLNKNIYYTFLQHGVIKDDLSSWLNSKPIDLFITSTLPETLSICENGSPYKFSENSVAMTGLPRYDKLYEISKNSIKDKILVMPTWRNGIVGKATGRGNKRAFNDDFIKSSYASHWKSFLHSNALKEIANKHGKEIIFFPHANIIPYIDTFETPEHIKVEKHDPSKSIQKLLSEALLLITDYSSIAFDVAYLKTPVMYFQFDQDEVFNNSIHIYKKGYFDYETHGFGPISQTLNELNRNLEEFCINNFKTDNKFYKRMDDTFPHERGVNCKSVFNKIRCLGTHDARETLSIEMEKVFNDGRRTEINNNFSLAINRYEHVENNSSDISLKKLAHERKIICYVQLGKAGRNNKYFELIIKNKSILPNAYLYLMAYYDEWENIVPELDNDEIDFNDNNILGIIIRSIIETKTNKPILFRKVSKKLSLNKNILNDIINGKDAILINEIMKLRNDNFFLTQIVIDRMISEGAYSESEKIISSSHSWTSWQYHREFARLRSAEGKPGKAKWHYDQFSDLTSSNLSKIDEMNYMIINPEGNNAKQ